MQNFAATAVDFFLLFAVLFAERLVPTRNSRMVARIVDMPSTMVAHQSHLLKSIAIHGQQKRIFALQYVENQQPLA